MAVELNDLMAQFATTGFVIRRTNPGGKMALADRLLGFAGVVDLADAVDATTKKGSVSLKRNTQEWFDVELDFSLVASIIEVSVQETVTVFNTALAAASITDVTASVDADTSRLRLAFTSGVPYPDLQIKSKLAGALNFGGCRMNEGLGCYWKKYINDEVKSIAPTVDRTENENIDSEGALGTITRITIKGHRNGVALVITTKYLDQELKQMVEGGRFYPSDGINPAGYEPPLSDDLAAPNCTVMTFSPMYDKGQSNEGQEVAYKSDTYYACLGTVGDVSSDAKAIADHTYNLNANEYTDENGTRHAPPKEGLYTPAQWEALNVRGW
jgi:hypothetical protein